MSSDSATTFTRFSKLSILRQNIPSSIFLSDIFAFRLCQYEKKIFILKWKNNSRYANNLIFYKSQELFSNYVTYTWFQQIPFVESRYFWQLLLFASFFQHRNYHRHQDILHDHLIHLHYAIVNLYWYFSSGQKMIKAYSIEK